MSFPRVLIAFLILFVFFGCRENNMPTYNFEPVPQIEDNALIKVTSPTYMENWYPGTNQIIKWDFEKDIAKVNILLYRKDIMIMTIAREVDNNSYYNWAVPVNISYSHHYRIKVVDAFAGTREDFSDYFLIIANP